MDIPKNKKYSIKWVSYPAKGLSPLDIIAKENYFYMCTFIQIVPQMLRMHPAIFLFVVRKEELTFGGG